MLKQPRKFLFILCFIWVLALCPIQSAQAELVAINNQDASQMNLIQQDVKVDDLDIEPINTQQVKKTVVPDTNKEGKKVMAYFIRAMLAVVFCAIILYLVLVFVKKYYGSAFVNLEEEEYFEAFDLSTPNNKQDALKAFLNRTK